MNLSVNIAGVTWKNPVTTASGTFNPFESSKYYDISLLGAATVKGVSAEPWRGNPPPRIAETYGGMLNAVGLQNNGVSWFIDNELPFLRKFDTKIIVNVCGHTVSEYVAAVEKLNAADVDMLELNISCPNLKEGGMAFGSDKNAAFEVVSAVRKATKHKLIVKLSPNVADIAEIAKAAEAAGADALSLINTLVGMRIDVKTRKPILANGTGGLSGAAIHPVAVRMVRQVYNAVKLPIIGMGGVTDGETAVEMMLAGASGVAVGTAALLNPTACVNVIDGIREFMIKYNVSDVNEIVGAIENG